MPDPKPNRRTTSATGTWNNPTPLDCIFILFASVLLLLLVFWLVQTIRGGKDVSVLPGFLTTTASKIWGSIILGGGTALSAAARKWLDAKPCANYLICIPGFTVVLLLLFVGVNFVMGLVPTPSAAELHHFRIHFNASFEKPKAAVAAQPSSELPELKFAVRSPDPRDPLGLFPKNGDPYPYWHEIDVPTSPKMAFVAEINRIRTASSYDPQFNGYDFQMCLKSVAGKAPAENSLVKLSCSGSTCVPSDGEENVRSCDSSTALPGTWLVPLAHADTPADKVRPGWVVPSLDTLDKMTDRERVGYTRFDVQFTPSAKVASADHYYYSLFVNDVPVYVDGFLPDRTRLSFTPNATNNFSFALENLNFTGQFDGYERLRLEVVFLRGDTEVQRQEVERTYIALRDAPGVDMKTDAGAFHWSGTYVVPKNENRFEVLVSSTPNVRKAMAAKHSFESAQLVYDGAPLTMVVRPPLRVPPFYGLALALVLPSKQVQFTFDQQDADKLCSWAKAQAGKGAGGKLIGADLRRYEVATRGYAPCK